ncbi:MAG: hypothetical protein A2V98_05135 [Planctomycetes bacterium RBG_16_64_12]|nr:MAG: hypothetical protein A2V98_05135 [Planctomycetes bacterium RBG_16_64_12]
MTKSKPETVYCGRCKKHVSYHYDPVNHWKQLFLTVFTLSMWLPMWLCLTFCPTKLCDECGGPLWGAQA